MKYVILWLWGYLTYGDDSKGIYELDINEMIASWEGESWEKLSIYEVHLNEMIVLCMNVQRFYA